MATGAGARRRAAGRGRRRRAPGGAAGRTGAPATGRGAAGARASVVRDGDRSANRAPPRSTTPAALADRAPSSGTNAGAIHAIGPPRRAGAVQPSSFAAPLRISRSRARVIAT